MRKVRLPVPDPAPVKGAVYTCPMHPEVRQDGPGDCPKCGMALKPLAPTVPATRTEWTYPMHPEVIRPLAIFYLLGFVFGYGADGFVTISDQALRAVRQQVKLHCSVFHGLVGPAASIFLGSL
jgi:hypothetical protein